MKGLVAGQAVTVPGSAFDGIEFTWPEKTAGGFDSWVPHGQVIPMGGVRAGKIAFLGLATNGPSTGATAIVYTDGTTQEVPVDFTDWTTGAPVDGNTIVAATSGRNTGGGGSDTTEARVFATEPTALHSTKLVEEVILPDNVEKGIEHIFDVATDSLTIPTLAVGATAVTAGEAVSFTGSDYTPNETVEVALEGASGTVATGTALVDGSGGLNGTFTVPGRVPSGSYELTVTGVESGFPLGGPVTVSGFAPAIAATAAVMPGETVEVSGSGYAPEEELTLTFAGRPRKDAAGGRARRLERRRSPRRPRKADTEVVAVGFGLELSEEAGRDGRRPRSHGNRRNFAGW